PVQYLPREVAALGGGGGQADAVGAPAVEEFGPAVEHAGVGPAAGVLLFAVGGERGVEAVTGESRAGHGFVHGRAGEAGEELIVGKRVIDGGEPDAEALLDAGQ